MNPKHYKKQIEKLGIDGFEIKPESLMDATTILIRLKEYQRILRQIKYNLRIDARNIRREYITKTDELNESLKENKKSDKKAKEAKKKLLKEKEELVAPYDALDNLIDGYMVQIEDSKIFLREFIKNQVK
ncbi:MAG: hypothetical protein Q7U35_02960 [Methanobacteriaceae archaeon]|nr:hypothetical protein [Methanobacteriaceae archaeon]MDP2836872.1 hypothetical protein [Methanobacteriaceae archaeon]MDP3034498.1 hypothetical protein [Methanobacteriaceae archaeon]MDP3484223.1 hypothetical protein [Methanobacteriaceae archaeon]MDP3623851.1 hypothetical protein [Methanobacteriaceae archaeon]